MSPFGLRQMEANFFRALALELGEELCGARINKIFAPAPDVWTFVLTTRSGKNHLLFRPSKTDALLFLAEQKPENPAQPPARVMWYRKRVSNRRILSYAVDWPNLRLAFELSPGEGRWLVLDMRDDLRLTDELDDSFGVEPDWPSLERILEDADIWREFPHISPPLRKVLNVYPPELAEMLLANLAARPADSFYVAYGKGVPFAPAAWPLPDQGGVGRVDIFRSALEAAAKTGEPRLYPYLRQTESRERDQAVKALKRRIKRSLGHLASDREKLEKMVALQVQAEALQAELYKYTDGPVPERVVARHPEHGKVEVLLNPFLSASENLDILFRKAAKGRRGLEFIARRERVLEEELENDMARLSGHAKKVASPGKPDSVVPKKYTGMAVRLYRTSDGFLLVRGKNSKANHQLLSQAASPFDLWFHAKDVPGAHVVLKRDHPAQEVPETSLREAAALAAYYSGNREAPKAEVLCAYVKQVRKIKGAALGLVRVDELKEVLYVEPGAELEERLAL